jgi:hypothetical protein
MAGVYVWADSRRELPGAVQARVLPLRRPTRRDRAVATIRDGTSSRTLAAAAAVVVGVAVLALAARRWRWRAVGVTARAVEEAADTVEDAAEDLVELARERAAREAT